MQRHRPRIAPDGRALLNVGCGSQHHPEWTNVDLAGSPSVVAVDLRRGIPFDDSSFDVVYHSHVLEHFRPADGMALLRECRRVLRPGGTLRVVVPDLEHDVRLYLECLEGVRQSPGEPRSLERYEWSVLNLIDQLSREWSGGLLASFVQRPLLDPEFVIRTTGGTWAAEAIAGSHGARGAPWRPTDLVRRALRRLLRRPEPELAPERHRWMYDAASLTRAVEQTGLRDVRRAELTISRIPAWERFRLDLAEDGRVHKPGSLVVEGTR